MTLNHSIFIYNQFTRKDDKRGACTRCYPTRKLQQIQKHNKQHVHKHNNNKYISNTNNNTTIELYTMFI